MRANELVITLMAAVALSACGGDDGGGGGDPEPVTDQNTLNLGKTSAQSTSSLAGIQAGADAQGAQGPVTTVGNSVMALANQYRAAKLQAQAMAQGLAVAAIEQAQEAGDTGTITFENNHLSADLHYTSNTGSGTAVIDYVADLDIIPVDGGGFTFDGTFGIAYKGNTAGYDIDYAYDAEYGGLKLDAANCPIDGSLSVDYDLSISGGALDQLPPQQRAQINDQMGGEGSITLNFGPNCGDVAAEGT